jgi:hypothetical protein
VRIGLVVDGIGERDALPKLYNKIQTEHTLLQPIKRDIQPMAPAGQIALVAAGGCRILAVKRVDLAVVLVDFERREGCPGAFALQVQGLIEQRIADLGMDVAVVVKFRAFENWLIADPDCLSRAPAQFTAARDLERAFPAGRADHVEALPILERATGQRRSYHKVYGAVSICTHLDPARAARNSRSLRRFLRVLGDSRYADQSRRPASDPGAELG